jgi:hypothetical protein
VSVGAWACVSVSVTVSFAFFLKLSQTRKTRGEVILKIIIDNINNNSFFACVFIINTDVQGTGGEVINNMIINTINNTFFFLIIHFVEFFS